jgi:hypothetical protein
MSWGQEIEFQEIETISDQEIEFQEIETISDQEIRRSKLIRRL